RPPPETPKRSRSRPQRRKCRCAASIADGIGSGGRHGAACVRYSVPPDGGLRETLTREAAKGPVRGARRGRSPAKMHGRCLCSARQQTVAAGVIEHGVADASPPSMVAPLPNGWATPTWSYQDSPVLPAAGPNPCAAFHKPTIAHPLACGRGGAARL